MNVCAPQIQSAHLRAEIVAASVSVQHIQVPTSAKQTKAQLTSAFALKTLQIANSDAGANTV